MRTVKIPSLPTRSTLDQKQEIRQRLEDIKYRLGRSTNNISKHGMDKRVAIALLEARPDLKSNEQIVMPLVRVTLDELMHDVLFAAGLDPQIMEYEYSITYGQKSIIITGDSGYRAKVKRPKNKETLEKSIKREVTLALQNLFEDRQLPVPDDFINRATDAIGRETTKIYLDMRITDATIGSVTAKKHDQKK